MAAPTLRNLIPTELIGPLKALGRHNWLAWSPGTGDLPCLEGVECVAVVLRRDRDIASTLWIGLQPLPFQPVPQRDILRVAELWRSDLLATSSSTLTRAAQMQRVPPPSTLMISPVM